MSVEAHKRDAWSKYWAKDFLTTFAADPRENYSGLIAAFWKDKFSRLKPGSTIVDLGAGNGAILALAYDFSVHIKGDFRLVAVDSASIGDFGYFYKKVGAAVTVLASTPMEKTGLGSQSVDLCASQFGFEYSSVPESAEEVGRIVKPGGYFCCIVHHNLSPLIQAAKSVIDQIKICRDSKLYHITESLLLQIYDDSGKAEPSKFGGDADALRRQYNTEVKRVLSVSQNLDGSDYVIFFLTEISGLFSRKALSWSKKQRLDYLKMIAKESAAYETRMQSMIQASRDENGIDEIASIFAGLDFEGLDIGVLQSQDEVIGWSFSAQKSR